MLTEAVVLYHLLSAHVMCKQVQLQCMCLAVTKMCTAVFTSAQQQVPCICVFAVCIKLTCITCPMGSAGVEGIYREDFMHHLYNSYAMLYLIESSQHIT